MARLDLVWKAAVPLLGTLALLRFQLGSSSGELCFCFFQIGFAAGLLCSGRSNLRFATALLGMMSLGCRGCLFQLLTSRRVRCH